MESCFPLLKKFSPRSHYNGTCSKTCHDEEKESVNTKDFTNGNSSIPSIRYARIFISNVIHLTLNTTKTIFDA